MDVRESVEAHEGPSLLETEDLVSAPERDDGACEEVSRVLAEPAPRRITGFQPFGAWEETVGHSRQRGTVGLDFQHEGDRVVARRRRPGRTRYGCDFPVCETLTHERPDVRRGRIRVRVEQDEERSRRAKKYVVVRLLEVAARRTGTKDGGVREKVGRENAGLRIIEDLDDDLVSRKRARHAGEPQPREV